MLFALSTCGQEAAAPRVSGGLPQCASLARRMRLAKFADTYAIPFADTYAIPFAPERSRSFATPVQTLCEIQKCVTRRELNS